MATLYDVCEKTGFSTATVSRVINGSGLVKKETRERVLQAMAELNYHPSDAARRLAGSKTDTIGVVLPLLDNGYYVRVLRGIDNISTRENLKLLISFYHSEDDLTSILSSLCGEGRTDGIILMNNAYFGPEKVRQLTGNDTPVALIGQDHESLPAIDSVMIDNFQGAYAAIEHLLQSQPQSLVLITGPLENHDSNDRLRGAEKALDDAAHKPDVTILTGDFYRNGGQKVFEEYIQKQGSVPDAVFAFNDAMALGVLDALERHAKKVPEDLQIIGFDNNELAEFIGMSTITFPMTGIGEEAAKLLSKRIKDKELEPTRITMETSLLSRKTTR